MQINRRDLLKQLAVATVAAPLILPRSVLASGMLLPTRNASRVKPPGMPRINWRDPRTRGLIRLWLFDGTIPFDLVTGTRATVTGSPVPVAQLTQAGPSTYFNNQSSAATYYTAQAGPIIGGLANWSILWGFVQTAAQNQAGDGGCFYSERATSGNDIIKATTGGFGGNAGKIGFVYRNDAGTLINNYGGVSAYDGLFHVAAMTKAGASAGNNCFAYLDGSQTVASSWNTNDNFTNAGIQATIGGDVADSSSYVSGNCNFVALYNQALLPTTVLSLSMDPFGFLIYPKDSVVGTLESIISAIKNNLLLIAD